MFLSLVSVELVIKNVPVLLFELSSAVNSKPNLSKPASDILELIVADNESHYVNYFNNSHAVTPRLHSLEMIPGIGKTFLSQILKERENKPFTSFSDISDRINLKEPAQLIAKRLIEEISGDAKLNLFVRN